MGFGFRPNQKTPFVVIDRVCLFILLILLFAKACRLALFMAKSALYRLLRLFHENPGAAAPPIRK